MYLLVNDIFFATKIVKAVQAVKAEARAFDSAGRLFHAAKEKEPALVIMDCEGLEKEAFRVLQEFRSEPALVRVPRVGYLSHTAQNLKREMLAAGALHVYAKSEFSKELDDLLVRYTRGISSRI